MNDDFKWLLAFVGVDFANRALNGLFLATLGPAQPYLAQKVNVHIDTIAWIYTFTNIGYILGAVLSSVTFKRWVRRSVWKLLVSTLCALVVSAATAIVAVAHSLQFLAVVLVVREIANGYWSTACSGIPVYAIGPIRSRTLIMAQHFVVGVGFFAAPFLLAHYFPANESGLEVCSDNATAANIHNATAANLRNVSPDHIDISAPFLIIAGMIGLAGLGYLLLLCLPFPMPVHEGVDELPSGSSLRHRAGTEKSVCSDVAAVVATFVFYAAICGSERMFQAVQFTFAMCGPLKLRPQDAVKTDKFFNGGFMTGRFLSMAAVRAIPPHVMLKLSASLCVLSSALVAVMGATSAAVLFASAFLFGLAISWQFAAGYSRCAEHMDVVGWRASLFSVGSSFGATLAPLAAAYLFKWTTPMAVWYLNMALVSVQVISLVTLECLFLRWTPRESKATTTTTLSGLTEETDYAQEERLLHREQSLPNEKEEKSPDSARHRATNKEIGL